MPVSSLFRAGTVFLLLVLTARPVTDASAQTPFSETAAGERLAEAITDTIETKTFVGAFWGIHVVNLRSGAVLYSRNADKNFVPASNVKLFTTAAGLERLGPDFRYVTTAYADGPVKDGTLKGNLIVRGAGDPTIGGYEQRDAPTQVFRQWADSLKAQGITHVAGNIIGDDDRLDETPLGRGWSWSDITYAYAAQIGALVFNENTIDMEVRGRRVGQSARITWEPFNTDYVTVVNRSRTVPSRADEDEEYQRLMGTNTIHVETTVHPNGRASESITISNPTLYFTHILRRVLLEEGISVDGRAADLDATGTRPSYGTDAVRQVASYTSPPLADIVQTLNHESQNLYAEQLLRTLARTVPPDSVDEDLKPGSSPLGVKAVRETLGAAEVDTSRVELVDGSGLSRQNLVQPRALVRLLQHMWLHPNPTVSSAFYDVLPEGGEDGTLEYRFQGTAPANGNVRAKTGTLSNTSALGGYVESSTGTPIAFSLFCNHHTADGDQVRSAQDVIVNTIARLPLQRTNAESGTADGP
ncbi:MAG: D-alanyl-D-alanine carboxypeptidase/D-alanyl-D-alanine-endopeptidase [Bacteroidetes bacterium SW_9_63_38]|nr:MAG: D-alanyl-D-alanine carboxypeptidase/D-alanyl-D-alanine-endopeptidase [Bacteroidetes bacterium SW_9_63_38]